MALRFILDHETDPPLAGELGIAGLFGIEVIEASLPGNYLSFSC